MVRPNTPLRTGLDLLTIVILFLLAYWIYSFLDERPSSSYWTLTSAPDRSMSYVELEESKREISKRDAALYTDALASKNLDQCGAIQDVSERIRCEDSVKGLIAYESGDTGACSTLSSSGMSERCQDNIAYKLATQSGSTQICQSISDTNLRLSCRDEIYGAQLEAAIASGSTLTESFCLSLSGSTRDRCLSRIVTVTDTDIYQKAIGVGDLSECENIVNTATRTRCIDIVIFDTAMKESSPEICDRIGDESRRSYCRETLITQNDVTLYKSLIIDGEITQCENISTQSLKEQCHDMIIFREVRANQDTSPCDGLYNTGMIFSCQNLVQSQDF